MEFFQKIQKNNVEISHLQNSLTINSLPSLCNLIDTSQSINENQGEIYCLWGSFDIRREVIKYGVRFSLLNCPHALAWTITYHGEEKDIVIHCTIDETEQDNEFVESIDSFVKEWSRGMNAWLQNNK